MSIYFDHRVKLEFYLAAVRPNAGLLAYRELPNAVGLTALANNVLADARTGKNVGTHWSVYCDSPSSGVSRVTRTGTTPSGYSAALQSAGSSVAMPHRVPPRRSARWAGSRRSGSPMMETSPRSPISRVIEWTGPTSAKRNRTRHRLERESDLRRSARHRLQRSLRLRLLSSPVRVQSVRRSEMLRVAPRQGPFSFAEHDPAPAIASFVRGPCRFAGLRALPAASHRPRNHVHLVLLSARVRGCDWRVAVPGRLPRAPEGPTCHGTGPIRDGGRSSIAKRKAIGAARP